MIISGFPGVGKSSAARLYQDIIDLDSAAFDKAHFPENYIKAIQAHQKEHCIVLVSSHQGVREALYEANLPFMLVYPNVKRKEELKALYRARGNDEAFIDLVDTHWEEWIYACDRHEGDCYILGEGFFLSDVIERLAAREGITLKLKETTTQ